MPGNPPPLHLVESNALHSQNQWTLPRRPWGAAWFLPWVLIAAGLIELSVYIAIAWPFFTYSSGGTFDVIGNALSLLGLAVFSIGGLILILAGAICGFATTTITLAPGQLRTTDRFGPLRWTRRIATDHITNLDINVGTVSTNDGPSQPTENVCMLIAKTNRPMPSSPNQTRDFIIAWAYPRSWLAQLTEKIAQQDPSRYPNMANIAVTESFGSDDDTQREDKSVARPPDAIALVTRNAEGLTIDVPPVGIRKGSKGLLFFAIFWNGFLVLMLAGIIASYVFSHLPNVKTSGSPWGFLFFLPFLAVGGILIAICLHAGRSTTRLVVIGTGTDAVLAYHRTSPVLKDREQTWPISELTQIRSGASNMSVNDVPVRELQIHPKAGKKVGLLARLDDHEIDWLAWELRQQTGLPKDAIDMNADDESAT